MKTFTLKCPDMRWKGCNMFEPGVALFDLICIRYVYSISSKSMRSKSRRGWTCCRTSSSTSTHSASKTKSCIHLNRFGVESTCIVMVVLWLSDVVKLPEKCQFIQFKSLNSSVTILCWHHVSFTCFLFSFFQDGLKAVDNLKPSIEKLATDLHTVRKTAALVGFFFFLLLTLTFPSHMHHTVHVSALFFLSCFLHLSFATDKAGAGWGEETADSVTRRPQVCATGGAEGGNIRTHTHTRPAEGVQLLFNVKERQSNVTFTLKSLETTLNLLNLTWWVLI